ncbi:MAG: SWIM zinc finger family protein [Gammaproteobacteria bacterium]|nr:MAG: SWIM zinc finger family protein [Gammaproteobacteria bacterium]
MALSKVLTTNRVRRWAGSRSYGRGEDYFHGEHVSDLKAVKGRITATVYGTYPYRVMLWDEGDSIGYDCDCPVGQGGDFCKHCVATALAWLEKRTPAGKTGKGKGRKKADKGLTMKDVRAWLLLQEKESLVDMLVEAADYDSQLSGTLMLKAAVAKGVNLVTYRKVLDQAIGIDGFIDYHDMYEYWRGVDSAIDGVDELLKSGHAAAVVELSEYALHCLEGAMNNAMDDGEMGMLQHRLEELHLKACRKAKPDPEALAERLFDWELTGEWGTFWDAGNTHGRVMGKNGMRRYHELAEAEWDKVKPLQPGDDTRDKYGKRSCITHIMENLALQSGDIEALVAVMSRDLSSSYDFFKIAEVYRKARKGNKAMEWAEKGIQLFGEKADSHLQDLLAELYHRRKRHDEAMSLVWLQFERRPCLVAYQHLKKHADRSKQWRAWRERALELVHAEIDGQPKGWTRSGKPGHSLLVEIYLWEQDIEAAWQAANAGSCGEALWLELAGLREKTQPRDAIMVYRMLIGPIVERTNNQAYAQAAGLLRRVKQLMGKLGEDGEFCQYLAQVRVDYKRKRNFMKLLEKFGV